MLSFAFASLALFGTGFGQPAQAQSGAQLWVNTLPGSGASGIAIDSSGDAIVSGWATNPGAIGAVKYSPAGVLIWSQQFSAPNFNLVSQDMALDPAGDVFVGATAWSYSTGQPGGYGIVKFDPNGNLLWGTVLLPGAGGGSDLGGMAVDSSGNLFVTGTFLPSSGIANYVTTEISPAGGVLWSQTFENGFSDIAHAIALDSAGNVYVAGSAGNSVGGSSYSTVKYSSSGIQQWVANYTSGLGLSQPVAMVLDSSGNIIVTGAGADTVGDSDIETVKFSPTGTQLWSTAWTPGGSVTGMVLDPSGNTYLTGCDNNGGSAAPIITKYDPSGNQLWNVTAGILGGGNAITLDASGNVCVACTEPTPDGFSSFSALLRYSSGGDFIVGEAYDSGYGDAASCIAADTLGDVFVAGGTNTPAGGGALLTAEYSSLGGVPLANAGGNQTFTVPHNGNPSDETMSFTLNGGGSSLDGGTLTYSWMDSSNNVVGTGAALTTTEGVGTYTFTLTVTDSISGLTAQSSATVTINPQVDTAPTVGNESVSCNENSFTSITLDGQDTYDDALYYLVGRANHGSLTFNSDSTLVYTPAAGYYGPDSFTYQAIDPYGMESGTATVSIAVSYVDVAPVAQNQSVTTHNGTAITLKATPSNGQTLTYKVMSGPTNGTLSGTAPNLTYTPKANWNGSDSFTFIANDGTLNSNVATVNITVTDQNPIAGNVSATTKKGTAVTISVLGSDSDPDGDAITITSFTQPANGSVVKNANNTFTFTPSKTFTSGKTSFTYTINDNHGGYATGTVTVTVTK